MKLKNIIKVGSFVVAGTLPTTSQGQVYECRQCPAGTYSDGTQTQCTPCPAGKYSNPGATSCSTCSAGTYSTGRSSSCTPCPSGQTSSAGASSCYTPLSCSGNSVLNASKTQCLSLLDKNRWVQYGSVKGGNCQDITLYPNIQYLVYLRGGDGGGAYREVHMCEDNDINDNMYCDYVEKTFGIGAYVEYKFTVASQTSAKICAGENAIGVASWRKINVAGGGGSWIQIGDKYIVAGGGYGSSRIGTEENKYHVYGGGGGAIGGGGSGYVCDDGALTGSVPGKGGNIYDGGGRIFSLSSCSFVSCGFAGEGLDGIGGGHGGSRKVESSGGTADCGAGLGGEVNSSRLFTGFARSGRLGGSFTDSTEIDTNTEENTKAKSSHDSNFSLNLGCQTLKEGCAVIYKFNNN